MSLSQNPLSFILNRLDYAKFANIHEVKKVLENDISQGIGTNVHITLLTPKNWDKFNCSASW
jgi:NADPH-dependent 7-cyano-7-deazaguanine reductase QueF-like protein